MTATKKIKVGIYGASGYAGQDLVEILARHQRVDLVFATSNTYSGMSVSGTQLTYTPPDQVDLNAVDAVFSGVAPQSSRPGCRSSLAGGGPGD